MDHRDFGLQPLVSGLDRNRQAHPSGSMAGGAGLEPHHDRRGLPLRIMRGPDSSSRFACARLHVGRSSRNRAGERHYPLADCCSGRRHKPLPDAIGTPPVADRRCSFRRFGTQRCDGDYTTRCDMTASTGCRERGYAIRELYRLQRRDHQTYGTMKAIRICALGGGGWLRRFQPRCEVSCPGAVAECCSQEEGLRSPVVGGWSPILGPSTTACTARLDRRKNQESCQNHDASSRAAPPYHGS